MLESQQYDLIWTILINDITLKNEEEYLNNIASIFKGFEVLFPLLLIVGMDKDVRSRSSSTSKQHHVCS